MFLLLFEIIWKSDFNSRWYVGKQKLDGKVKKETGLPLDIV